MAAHRVGSESSEIGSACYFLREELLSIQGSGTVAHHLAMIDESLGRIDSLVKEFTEFAKPPAPKMERININQLCREAMGDKPGIQLDLKLSPQLPAFWGDRESCAIASGNGSERIPPPDRGQLRS